jgi:TfoX/Sxy family transcriptional regulator of competence genes
MRSPPELVALFDAALPDDPRVVRRKMFGYPAAFIGGAMAAGLFENGVVAKLSEADRARALAAGGKPFEPTKGRVMGAFITLPRADIGARKSLAQWLEMSIEHVGTLPPKQRKSGAAKRATTGTRRR